MAGTQNAKGCMVCGKAPTVSGVAPPFAFCGGCSNQWRQSYERVRWALWSSDPRGSTAFNDFVRRLQAERLNGEQP